MSAIQAKLDQRGKIYNQMLDLKNRAKSEDRSLTDEEKGQWDTMFCDYQKIGDEIKSIEKEYKIDETMDRLELEQKSVFDKTPKGERKPDSPKTPEYRDVVEKWMRNPKKLTSADINVLETRGTSTNVTTNDGLGGYIVPEEWATELIKTMEAYGGMLEVSRIVSTSHGRTMHIPTVPFAGGGAAATQKGHLITENTGDTVSDINFLEKQLDAYVYSSYEIQLSWELMQDAMFDVPGLVLSIGGERNGRIVNEHLTVGTGSGQPNGAVTASGLGKTAAAAGAITGDEIVDLKHSVNRAYRSNARFMMNDSTLGYITKLSYGVSDTSVWVPSFAPNVPDTILGHPYTINDDMASIATTAKTILFGDFSKYWVRQAGYPEIARSDERDMANRRSVFYVFSRYDGELVDANAIKHLVQA